MPENEGECFLCRPDANLIYLSDGGFRAMLGIGPIVEGYTVLSSVNHIRSMFDLPSGQIEQFLHFRLKVIKLLKEIYGTVIITEHGRVPNCDFYDLKREPHCYHAHQLLFPVQIDLKPELYNAFKEKVIRYDGFAEAQKSCFSAGEYAYYEDANGKSYVAQDAKYPRQYFRMIVAEKIGHLERVDWHNWQGWELIDNARTKLKDMGCRYVF
jgi:hypothetical protein